MAMHALGTEMIPLGSQQEQEGALQDSVCVCTRECECGCFLKACLSLSEKVFRKDDP